ncbi:MAG: phosphate ABC transporter permease PstA [Alphaproteobacteria bacterium]
MTNITTTQRERPLIKDAVRTTLRRRYMFEYIFRGFGLGAIGLALVILSFLLYSLISQGLGAFSQTHFTLDITYPQSLTVSPSVQRDPETNKILKDDKGNYLFNFSASALGNIAYEREGKKKIRFNLSQLSHDELKAVVAAAEPNNFKKPLRDSLRAISGEKSSSKLVNVGAEMQLRKYLQKHPDAVGQRVSVSVPAQADFDYWWRHGGKEAHGQIEGLDAQIAAAANDAELSKKLKNQRIRLLGRFEPLLPAVHALDEKNLVSVEFSSRIFTHYDASEADYAGLRSAIVGTAYTMLVTFLISFIFGITAAVWLEEFAPKGRMFDIIEVNINNLAAVPSIVKGILGLLVFQMLIGLPRGTPILGGIVLSLVAMPTIIVASRAALKAVPSSLKDGALGVGASNMQAVFQHVVPAALPGMLTGTIIGLAQALGETAPLLMIGMKAYVQTPPSGFDGFGESATTIAATIYNWFSLGKDSFNELASAAILVLLFFLLCMNALAVYLRKKFELDW